MDSVRNIIVLVCTIHDGNGKSLKSRWKTNISCAWALY